MANFEATETRQLESVEQAAVGTNRIRVIQPEMLGRDLVKVGPHYVIATVSAGDPRWLGSGQTILADDSSPWWQGRVVGLGQAPSVDRRRLQRRKTPGAIKSLLKLLGLPHRVPTRTADVARSIENHLALDFGIGIVPAVPTGAVLAADQASPWFQHSANWFADFQERDDAWLRADDSSALAHASVVADDADWDETNESPTWLALEDTQYRGGGVMRRRRVRPSSD